MRRVLASLLLTVASIGALTACDPPPSAGPVGAAVVVRPPESEPLPRPVEATVKRLLGIAAAADVRAMAAYANETPGFRSNAAGMTHLEYWYLKMRAGDVPMVHMQRILSYRPAVRDSPQGKVYVWPGLAFTDAEDITGAKAREIDALLGPGQAEAIRNGGIWSGYLLGIREDGLWLYFLSGEG